MLFASDGITIGEKWTTVLPSIIDDGDFFTVWRLVPCKTTCFLLLYQQAQALSLS